jgi:hypothetical protein
MIAFRSVAVHSAITGCACPSIEGSRVEHRVLKDPRIHVKGSKYHSCGEGGSAGGTNGGGGSENTPTGGGYGCGNCCGSGTGTGGGGGDGVDDVLFTGAAATMVAAVPVASTAVVAVNFSVASVAVAVALVAAVAAAALVATEGGSDARGLRLRHLYPLWQ